MVTLGVPEHGPSCWAVVGQAAVLKSTCDHTAAHRLASLRVRVGLRMRSSGTPTALGTREPARTPQPSHALWRPGDSPDGKEAVRLTFGP